MTDKHHTTLATIAAAAAVPLTALTVWSAAYALDGHGDAATPPKPAVTTEQLVRKIDDRYDDLIRKIDETTKRMLEKLGGIEVMLDEVAHEMKRYRGNNQSSSR